EECVDAPAGQRRGALQRVVYADQRRRVEQAARDARLVGRDHHPVVRLREAGDRLQAAFERRPLGDRLDVRLAVVVDGAVPVQDNELHFSTASLEMSATWFMSGSSLWRSSACRLARSAASSAFTM